MYIHIYICIALSLSLYLSRHAALACRANTPVNEPTNIVQVTRTFLLIMTRNDSNGHVVFFWKRSDLQDMISFIDAVMWPLSFPMKRS